MRRLGVCSDVVFCAVTSGVGTEPEGPASDVCLVVGPAKVITKGVSSIVVAVCAS